MLRYKINNEDIFERYGVLVSSDEGLTDRLAIKGIEEVDLPGQHGKDVDLSEIRFEARTITLKAGILAVNPGDLERRIARFRKILFRNDLLRLEVSGHGLALHYDIYCQSGFKVVKKWRDNKTVNTFTMTLIEPQPVKHVYRCREQRAQLSVNSSNALQISFGDGAVKRYCFEETIVHYYTDIYAPHYVIVAGVLESAVINTEMERICSVLS